MISPSNGDTDQSNVGAAINSTSMADTEQRFARGYQALHSGHYDRALIDFSWLVMLQPWNWRAHVALAGTLMMTKEY